MLYVKTQDELDITVLWCHLASKFVANANSFLTICHQLALYSVRVLILFADISYILVFIRI